MKKKFPEKVDLLKKIKSYLRRFKKEKIPTRKLKNFITANYPYTEKSIKIHLYPFFRKNGITFIGSGKNWYVVLKEKN